MPSESLPRPRRPLPTQQQPQPSQKLGRLREDEGAVAAAAVKELPEATATPEPLSDEDLPLDPDLYQDFCAGAFDDHGLVSRQSIPRGRVVVTEAESIHDEERGGRGYGILTWGPSRWQGSHEWSR